MALQEKEGRLVVSYGVQKECCSEKWHAVRNESRAKATGKGHRLAQQGDDSGNDQK